RGAVPALVTFLGIHTDRLLEIIFPITTLLIFQLLLRRMWAAVPAASLVGMVIFYPDSGSPAVYLGKILVLTILFWSVLFRGGGLLGFAAMFAVSALAAQMPLMPQPPAWYLGTMLVTLAAIAAPALYGFWISRAGRPLFREEVLAPARRVSP